MPSASLTHWQAHRMPSLGRLEAHCAALFAQTSPPPLAEESLQGYVMLVSGHFQGFCRDLYTECAQLCVDAVPVGLGPAVQNQFTAELKINRGNPSLENIRRDFERFGLKLRIEYADPANPVRISHLGNLNYWRNVVAHQFSPASSPGVPAVLTLANVQLWHQSCDGFARSLDGIMRDELINILTTSPW